VLSGGEHLSEALLSSRFSVSRTPIREVLRQLERDGFVTSTPNAGVNVIKITLKLAAEYFEQAAALEGALVEMTVERGVEDSQILDLVQLNDKMETSVREGDYQSYEILNNNFHNFFSRNISNDIILETLNNTRKKMYIPFNSIHQYGDIIDYIEQHREIVEYMKKSDAAHAGYAMRAHVRTVLANLLKTHDERSNIEVNYG
jgi:DNA-binding GntR family transcriptional regulator